MSSTRIKTFLSTAVLIAAAVWIIGLPSPAAGGPPVTVDEAIPNVGEQGAINLKVKIKGKGFAEGAQIRFLLRGSEEDDSDIDVGPTTFISSKELECDITIDSAAALDINDIEVVLLSGRKGKGTDAFRVTAPGGGGGNEIVMDVEMDGIEINPSTALCPLGSAAEVKVDFVNQSTLNGDGLTVIASIGVFAERCDDIATVEIDLDLPIQPQLNCTREDYHSPGIQSPAGVPNSLTACFDSLPAGDYIFFITLGVEDSQNYDWKHGFAIGTVQ